jgi:glycosyltransferase involved in cell wall biosynthesis
MTFKNLLMITYHFPPSAAVGGLRLLGFSRHLPKFDWQTEVVAPPTIPWEPVDQALLDQVSAETVIHAVPFTESRVIRRLAKTDSWLPKAWMACQHTISQRRPDAVLTSGPPHHVHLLGLGLKKWHGIPWVADFRDQWAWTARYRDPLSSPTSDSWWENTLEQAVIRHSDAIIVNAPLSCETFAAVYSEYADKAVVITNGYDPETFENLTKPDTVGLSIRVLYCGQIYRGRDPRPFLDALRVLLIERTAEQRPIRVDFFGAFRLDTQHFDLEVGIRSQGLENIVSVHSEIPHAQSLAEMVRSDILLLFDTPGRRIGVPAKIYEYIGSGRPILAMVESDSDTAWVLRQAGTIYRVTNPNDTESILRGLRELVNVIENEHSAIESNPGRLHFVRENLARQLAAVLDGCVRKVPGGSRV